MKKTVIGLSGGMDSATLLGLLLGQGYSVICCSFQYGSKHMVYESEAAQKIVDFYKEKGFPVELHTFDLSASFSGFDSALLKHGAEIPEGPYESDNMEATVVPGRNLIFSSLMAGLAESVGAESIALGVHSGDHHIYPDCRPEFVSALHQVVQASSDGKVGITTPLLHLDKTSILEIGYELQPNVPYHLTRTCYKDQPLSCGKCGSCSERLEAFKNINKKDHISYERRTKRFN